MVGYVVPHQERHTGQIELFRAACPITFGCVASGSACDKPNVDWASPLTVRRIQAVNATGAV